MQFISADVGSCFGSVQFNTCLANTIVCGLSIHGMTVSEESTASLIRDLRTNNGEFMSPLDDTSLTPKLNRPVEDFLASHRADIELYTDGKKLLAFKTGSNNNIVLRLNLVDYFHWEVLVDRSEYNTTKAMCRQEVIDREICANLAWVWE